MTIFEWDSCGCMIEFASEGETHVHVKTWKICSGHFTKGLQGQALLDVVIKDNANFNTMNGTLDSKIPLTPAQIDSIIQAKAQNKTSNPTYKTFK